LRSAIVSANPHQGMTNDDVVILVRCGRADSVRSGSRKADSPDFGHQQKRTHVLELPMTAHNSGRSPEMAAPAKSREVLLTGVVSEG
jgi:hypothetical protein